jgi:hypothetical protein
LLIKSILHYIQKGGGIMSKSSGNSRE